MELLGVGVWEKWVPVMELLGAGVWKKRVPVVELLGAGVVALDEGGSWYLVGEYGRVSRSV